jgi:hypothetical protein
MTAQHGSDQAREEPAPAVPGTGHTMTVSASLHAGTVQAVRSRVGKRGFSSYLEAALRRQLEQDNLAELVNEYISTEGDFTAEELAAARAELNGREDSDAGHAA